MTFLTNAKGEPLLLLGTQTHNSSVGDPEMMARELAAVKAYGGNLLEAPIYWYRPPFRPRRRLKKRRSLRRFPRRLPQPPALSMRW